MNTYTDILIVGGGPTGLMLACQLARLGIKFIIIEKEPMRTRESRAVGIQSKSMEIFQKLNIADEFLKKARSPKEAIIYFNSHIKFKLDFQNPEIKGAPFSKVFLLPQSDTEEILSSYLQKDHNPIEREIELISFIQTKEGIEANIKNHVTNQTQKIQCRFIVGCDGAKSTVREIMNIPFEGGSYQQEFVLADVPIQWRYPKDKFALFVSKRGLLAHIPLKEEYSRLIICGLDSSFQGNQSSVSSEEIENFVCHTMGIDIKLGNPIWSSRFHLHHRAVKQYQQGFAFLAGDAAHIHSPVAGQGMNTGLQDAENLAWKLALVLKYQASINLLDTYQAERQKVGRKLLATTDRIFGILTSKNIFTVFFKQYILSSILCLLSKSKVFQKKIFCFMSELAIHYHKNAFIKEYVVGADTNFLAGPSAGSRAPDASLRNTSLFELLRHKPFNILIFQNTLHDNNPANAISKIEQIYSDLIGVHRFIKSEVTNDLFDSYGVKDTAIYFIRPDGYIGFRAFGHPFIELSRYIAYLFNQQNKG